MRKTGRILSLTLVFVLLLTLFASCKKAPEQETKTTTNPISQSETKDQSTSSTQTEPTTEKTTAKPSTNPSTQPPSKPTSNGQKLVALTFDDGPSKHTRHLIEELNKRGAKATFFMVGKNVASFDQTVKFMSDSGHQLGNHTFDHKNIKKLSMDEFLNQINKTDDAVMKACGKKTTAFRPPEGANDSEKYQRIDKTITYWSVDPLDWKNRDTALVKSRVLSKVKDGSIILLHDLYPTSVQAAIEIVDELQKQGYKFVTVNELIQRDGRKINPHEVYFSAVPK